MRRGSRLPGILPALIALVLVSLVIAWPASAPAGERHAGTVLAVDPQSRTLTVDEFGAGGERRAFRVQVPREAVVLTSTRNQDGHDFKDAFRDSTISLSDIQIGDFVVIELAGSPDVARMVMVTLRRGAGL